MKQPSIYYLPGSYPKLSELVVRGIVIFALRARNRSQWDFFVFVDFNVIWKYLSFFTIVGKGPHLFVFPYNNVFLL